jgi:hypothetical protein
MVIVKYGLLFMSVLFLDVRFLTTVLVKCHVFLDIAPFTRYIVIDVSEEPAASTFGLVPAGPRGSQKCWIILNMEAESSKETSVIIFKV